MNPQVARSDFERKRLSEISDPCIPPPPIEALKFSKTPMFLAQPRDMKWDYTHLAVPAFFEGPSAGSGAKKLALRARSRIR
jgi:hypothetical protein